MIDSITSEPVSVLKQWFKHSDNRYSGLVYNDDRVPDGTWVTTTPAVSTVSTIKTASGSTYQLEDQLK